MKRAGGPDVTDAEPVGDAATADEPPAPRVARAEPRPITTADDPRPRRIRPASVSPIAARKPAPSAGSKAAEAVCRLDAGHRRIVELRLMGLDGKPVSLADIDADFILLDFWGAGAASATSRSTITARSRSS